jgi:phage baseplate assembly protein W
VACTGDDNASCRWGSKVDAVPDDADAETLLLHQVPRAVSLWGTRVKLAHLTATAAERKAQVRDVHHPDAPSNKEVEATVAGVREVAGADDSCEAVALAGCTVLLLLPPSSAAEACISQVLLRVRISVCSGFESC